MYNNWARREVGSIGWVCERWVKGLRFRDWFLKFPDVFWEDGLLVYMKSVSSADLRLVSPIVSVYSESANGASSSFFCGTFEVL
jgi:hypothetical protein